MTNIELTQVKITRNGRKPLRNHPTLIYGMLAAIVVIATVAIISVEEFDNSSVAAPIPDHTLSLDGPTSVTGVTWDSVTNTLTFDPTANGQIYSITQTSSSELTGNIVFLTGTDTTVIIDNININGNISLGSNADLYLFLAGVNKINGSIIISSNGASTASITIDSATSSGSSADSLAVTATGSNYSIYGAGIYSKGIINIAGGTVTTIGNSVGNGAYIYGIYGGAINISSGIVNATSGIYGDSINISGGTVTATGGMGGNITIGGNAKVTAISTGIGGVGISGDLIVTDGTVIATGGINASTINISGGTVTATSDNFGIRGNITISGGTVTATGDSDSSGIGISGSTISINGGIVIATGNGVRMSGTCGINGDTININGNAKVTATGNGLGGIGISGSSTINIGGNAIVTATSYGGNDSYNGIGIGNSFYCTINISGGTVTATENGTYNSVQYNRYGFGICGYSINITGGTVNATGSITGIGGIRPGGAHNGIGIINISGGTVIATGNGSGGGGFYSSSCGISMDDITISGNAKVTANGGMGIGGGLAVTGGTVTATGNGIGIYGLTISGGTVTAVGNGEYCYGIYGAIISGGIVTATGNGEYCTGIYDGTISGGTVTAIGNGIISCGIDGATISGNSASIRAYSSFGIAINVTSMNTGYFVNAILSGPLLLASSTLLIYSVNDPNTVLATLTSPAINYSAFALALPGAMSSTSYNIYTQGANGQIELLRTYDNSPVIFSVNSSNGYNSYGGTGNMTGSLPVTLGSSNIPDFVAVTDITGVSSSANAGITLALSGTAIPTNATNKLIRWTVKDAGTTGATISGNTLYAAEGGVVIVTATIDNGIATGTPFTKDFTITVSVAEDSSNNSNIGLLAGATAVTILVIATCFAYYFFVARRRT